MQSNHTAFTLVELVLAIALTVILTMLILPATHNQHHTARRASCMSNARQIGLAFKQYAIDNKDSFPAIGSNNSVTSSSVFLSLTNGGYLRPGRIYLCLSDMSKTGPWGVVGNLTSNNNSYSCLVADSTGTNGLTEAVSSDNPLVLDAELIGAPGYTINLTHAIWNPATRHKEGGNIMYVGGHAKFCRHFDTGTEGTNGYVVVP